MIPGGAQASVTTGAYNGEGYSAPEFTGRWKERVTVGHLLSHTGGLPAGVRNIWLKANPWFAAEVLPELRARIAVLAAVPAGS